MSRRMDPNRRPSNGVEPFVVNGDHKKNKDNNHGQSLERRCDSPVEIVFENRLMDQEHDEDEDPPSVLFDPKQENDLDDRIHHHEMFLQQLTRVPQGRRRPVVAEPNKDGDDTENDSNDDHHDKNDGTDLDQQHTDENEPQEEQQEEQQQSTSSVDDSILHIPEPQPGETGQTLVVDPDVLVACSSSAAAAAAATGASLLRQDEAHSNGLVPTRIHSLLPLSDASPPPLLLLANHPFWQDYNHHQQDDGEETEIVFERITPLTTSIMDAKPSSKEDDLAYTNPEDELHDNNNKKKSMATVPPTTTNDGSVEPSDGTAPTLHPRPNHQGAFYSGSSILESQQTVFYRDSMIGAALEKGISLDPVFYDPSAPTSVSTAAASNSNRSHPYHTKCSSGTPTTTHTTSSSVGRGRSGGVAVGLSENIMVLPVCRQYIEDRVSGFSYVPKVYRGLPDAGGTFHYHDHDTNPTGCRNRPPHFLCYLPPCVRKCPGVLEQNAICEWVGKWGFHRYFKNRHKARRRIFFIGFTFNLIALGLTVVSAMAGSRNFTLLTHTSFTRGRAQVFEKASNSVPVSSSLSETQSIQQQDPTGLWELQGTVTIDIGFRALARYDPDGVSDDIDRSEDQEFIITLNNFCENPQATSSTDQGMEIKELLRQELCGTCRGSSQSFVLSSIINIIIILRNMFSDITRMYPNYDLNCPNFYGSLMATVSVILGVYTAFAYQARCQTNLQSEFYWYSRNGNATSVNFDELNENDGFVNMKVTFDWYHGPGLNCLITATFLKIMDTIANYMVPTPTITRSWEEQQDYELEFGTRLDGEQSAHLMTVTRQQGVEWIANDTNDDDEYQTYNKSPAVLARQCKQREQQQRQQELEKQKQSEHLACRSASEDENDPEIGASNRPVVDEEDGTLQLSLHTTRSQNKEDRSVTGSSTTPSVIRDSAFKSLTPYIPHVDSNDSWEARRSRFKRREKSLSDDDLDELDQLDDYYEDSDKDMMDGSRTRTSIQQQNVENDVLVGPGAIGGNNVGEWRNQSTLQSAMENATW